MLSCAKQYFNDFDVLFICASFTHNDGEILRETFTEFASTPLFKCTLLLQRANLFDTWENTKVENFWGVLEHLNPDQCLKAMQALQERGLLTQKYYSKLLQANFCPNYVKRLLAKKELPGSSIQSQIDALQSQIDLLKAENMSLMERVKTLEQSQNHEIEPSSSLTP